MSNGRRRRPASVPETLKADHAASSAIRRRLMAPHRPVLVVVSGCEDDVGKRVRVEQTLLIGRDPEAGLTLKDGQASWHHARLEDRGDAWALVDLDSTNGIVVDGQRVSQMVLRPNDTAVLGGTVVRFELQDGVAQAYSEAVEQLLNIDDLSGLYVRRKFDAELAVMLEAARRSESCVSLLVMDMDGIKGINDTHGHLFGAYVIGEAGALIGDLIATRGIGCRFGGDEFLAALPNTGPQAAADVAEEIRRAIAEHAFEKDGVALHPGISIGVAGFPEHARNAPTLFQRADEALYRAKQAGKNRVSH